MSIQLSLFNKPLSNRKLGFAHFKSPYLMNPGTYYL